ncbi:restriction endonuclease subunit S [Hymenobacter sp. BT442]|uniref:Restriction endonuclease subunit S n=2 Tax=Hymenobacter negativus TaxID=2795026 RepID=A0ABS0Q5G8_9BACT|nr:restriction endonuclease subunit S [Hymenobacter negativus]
MQDINPIDNFVYSYSDEIFDGQGGAKFSNGQILFARITPCLENRKIAQVKLGEGGTGFGSTEFFVFDEKEEVSDINYLLYLLKTDYVINHAIGSMVGASGRQRADWQYFKNIKIPLPPLHLQRQIAAVLGRYDSLLENYQVQIATLQALAHEVYREWFVRGRGLGVIVGVEKELPVGWRKGKLREVLDFYIGGGWGQDEPDDAHTVGGHVVRGTDIPNLKKGQVNLDVYRYHKASNMASRELRAGDIVFEVSGGSTDQGLGRNVLITDEALAKFGDKVMPASFCKLIRADQVKISPYYLQQLLDHLLETQEMAQFEVQSTGISNFQFEDFIDYQPVIIPAMEAMNRFDKLVGPMYKKIGILSTQMATLRATRDALLPRLLSGQLAVEALETAEI